MASQPGPKHGHGQQQLKAGHGQAMGQASFQAVKLGTWSGRARPRASQGQTTAKGRPWPRRLSNLKLGLARARPRASQGQPTAKGQPWPGHGPGQLSCCQTWNLIWPDHGLRPAMASPQPQADRSFCSMGLLDVLDVMDVIFDVLDSVNLLHRCHIWT